MGIIRTVEWRLVCTPEETDGRIRSAFEKLDLSPEGLPGHIVGRAKRSMLKNRWAAEVVVDVTSAGRGVDGCVQGGHGGHQALRRAGGRCGRGW